MKVKKKYILIISLTLIVVMIIIVGIFFSILSRYNINFEDGKRYVKSGFSLQPADTEDITKHTISSHSQIDILHYDLDFDLYPEQKIIKSSVKITGLIKSNFDSNIELNFYDGFDISEVSINGLETKYEYSDNRMEVFYNFQIEDTFKIRINYEGTPENLGFGSFNFSKYNEKYAIYTLSEPIFASTWFPCNDIPSDKVLADIRITNDLSMTSVSNGILVGTKINSNRKTYHWQTKYPISTYLISIYSADYEYFQDKYITLENDSMNIDYYVFKDDLENAKKDFKIHPNALEIFSQLFGEYPFIKEKYGVAQFLWSFGAMEHQTITGIGNNFVSGNQFYTGMLVHELAHQWWGNAVTLETWKDIWLNEGFATYSEALYWEKQNGFSSLKSTMQSFLTNFDDLKLYNPTKLFNRIIYNKGAWVLHMLRRELGDKLFFNLLQKYYSKYKYKNASTIDFVNLVETISGRGFSQFFDQWVFEGDGQIELEYNYNQNFIDNEYEVKLNLFQIQEGYLEYNFILDLDFYFEDETKIRKSIRVKDRKSNSNFIFDGKVTKIDLDPDNWLAAKIHFINTSKIDRNQDGH